MRWLFCFIVSGHAELVSATHLISCLIEYLLCMWDAETSPA